MLRIQSLEDSFYNYAQRSKSQSIEGLPSEILQKIFDELPKEMGILHQQLPRVSKTFNETLKGAVVVWLNQGAISPMQVGLNTAKKAIQYFIDHQIQIADLMGFLITKEDLIDLSEYSSLKSLIFQGFGGKFTEDELIEALNKFHSLQSLVLSSIKFSISDLFSKSIGTLTHLKNLDLRGAYGCIKQNIICNEAFRALTHLQTLYIERMTLICDNGVPFKLTNLKTLTLENTEGNILSGAPAVFENLESLTLMGGKISADKFITFAKTHSNILELYLMGVDFSIDHILEAISYLPRLQSLRLEAIFDILEHHPVLISKLCPNLQSLCMKQGCYSFEKMQQMLSSLTHLKELFLLDIVAQPHILSHFQKENQPYISKDGQEALIQQFPHIKIQFVK